MRHDSSSNLTMNGCLWGLISIVLSFIILHQRILLLPSISATLLPSITIPPLPAVELFLFTRSTAATAAAVSPTATDDDDDDDDDYVDEYDLAPTAQFLLNSKINICLIN